MSQTIRVIDNGGKNTNHIYMQKVIHISPTICEEQVVSGPRVLHVQGIIGNR